MAGGQAGRHAQLAAFMAALLAAADGEARHLVLHTAVPAEVRRDWAVVLYSGPCEHDPGLRCATQGIGPCTLAETSQVVERVPEGFHPHRISLLDPAEFLGGPPLLAGPRGETGDPTGDPPS
jgi:hypothetical protein